MDGKDTLIPKKRRGPAPTGQGHQVMVRLHPELLAKVDGWLQGEANLSGKPANSRAHAIREILRERFDYGSNASLVCVNGEVGSYTVTFPALPGCTASGASVAQALENAAQALRDYQAAARDGGSAPREP